MGIHYGGILTCQEQDYPALGSSPHHSENFIPKLSIIQEINSRNTSTFEFILYLLL